MNFRERHFAIGMLALGVLVVGYFLVNALFGSFTSKYAQIDTLTGEVRELRKQANLAEHAKKKIAAYTARSLPASESVSRREYQNWLILQIQNSGLAEPNVQYKTTVKGGDLFTRQEFTATAKGTLPQAVEFLYAFYSQDWLHRISRLTIQPIKDSKLFNLSLTVDILSLSAAKDTPTLVPRPGKRLQLANSRAYYDTIVGRNLFGPPNNPPRVAVSGNRDVYLGRDADLTVKANDVDPLDKDFTFKLLSGDSASAKLDPKTGRFTWRPSEPGKYEFLVEALDDGYPAKKSQPEKIVINVREQPVAQQQDDGDFRGFDKSKFTVFTAVLDIEGQGEIWLYNRPDGEMLKLHQGDRFEIGSIKGSVAEIGEYDFHFDRDGKRLKLEHGDTLFNAKVVGETPTAAPSPQPSAEQPTSGTAAEAEASAQPAQAAGNAADGPPAQDEKAG